MIGRDPKTNRIRYRYYYAEHHGGGITSAEIEAGSAFKLTYKGRRGHFHVQRTEGDKVFVKHDGRPNAKEVEMTKSELRALLKAQHETIETKKREKAQEARRGKKRKGTERKKTQTPREKLTETAQPTQQPTTKDLFSMEGEERQKALRDFSKEDLLREGRGVQRQIKTFHEKIEGDEGVKRAKLKQEQAERAGDWKQAREHARDLKRERDRVTREQGGKEREYRIKDTIRHIQNEWTRRGLDIGEFSNFIHQKETTAPAQETPREDNFEMMPESSPLDEFEERFAPLKTPDEAEYFINTMDTTTFNRFKEAVESERERITTAIAGAAQDLEQAKQEAREMIQNYEREKENLSKEEKDARIDQIERAYRVEVKGKEQALETARKNTSSHIMKILGSSLDREIKRRAQPKSRQPQNLMEKRYTDAEKKVKDLMNKPREVYQAIQDASAEEVPYLFYEARKEYIKEDHPESVDDMIRELAGRMQRSGDGFLILKINEDVNQGIEGRYTAKNPDLFEGEITSIKRKDLSARAVHLAETAKDQDSGSRRSPVSLAADQELADIHEHLVRDTTLTDREALERFRYGKNPENRDKTRATMIQEIRESRGEDEGLQRTRYQQRTTSPLAGSIRIANNKDKPNENGSRPAEARKEDKRLIEKLEDTIRNHPESHREQAHTAMRLVTELKLAQSLKRYKDGHPTKGDEATKDNIYQIRRELRDRLQELTIGM
jgi:hypothetical protein